MVLIGIGLALMIKQLAPFYLDDETVLGLIFLFAGLSFFIYYFLAKTRSDQDKTDRINGFQAGYYHPAFFLVQKEG